MNPRYVSVADRAGHRCEYCLAPEAAFNLIFEVEHIIPPGRGGTSDMANLALACRACNLFKSDRIEGFDSSGTVLVRLFHPRSDRWNDHFFVAADAMIEGRSEIGKATIQLLQINAVIQIAARRLWLRMGLYAASISE